MKRSCSVARDDAFEVIGLGTQTINVLGNDTTESGETLSIVALQSDSTAGQVAINATGTRILYTPPLGFIGTDTFAYTIDDGTGLTAIATVSVTVPDLVAGSFFAGAVYMDRNGNAHRDAGEQGVAGVTIVLEGSDTNGSSVRRESKTTLDGEYRFDGLAPGTYTITEQQPAFLLDGQELLAQEAMDGDQFTITVSDNLITSGGNLFGERGLDPSLSGLNGLASLHQPGLFVVLDNDQLSWLESRGGWGGFESIDVTLNGGALTIRTRDAHGDETTGTVSMSDTSRVQTLGRAGNLLVLQIAGSSAEVLTGTISAAAADLFFAV